MALTAEELDRARGALLGAAVGDALGAGYEFGSAPLVGSPAMIGGGLGDFAPGEWTDDTAQTYAIARVAATGADLRTPAALDQIAVGFAEWFADDPPDVGNQTRSVLSRAPRHPTGVQLTTIAAELHARTGHTAGNGSLMRTSPVALAHLDDEDALVAAAYAVSALTHADPLAGDACVLWCLAVRRAVLDAEIDVHSGLARLPGERRPFWRDAIATAERLDPSTFRPNGYVVTALQAAWSAISHTPTHGPEHLVESLGRAIAIGDDTDTVASIAGALLGARWGASAVPVDWQRMLHGWPGGDAASLVALADATTSGSGGTVSRS